MKVRHLPAAFRHSPLFVLRHGLDMLAHTFTGTTLRSVLGLESERAVFERYRQQRRIHRDVTSFVANRTSSQAPLASSPSANS